jgi:hypothetical protein
MKPACISETALLLLLAALPVTAATDLPDPTRPAQTAAHVSQPEETADTGYRLSAIRIGADTRIAIISGETVRIGDHLGGARVARIEADGVVLEADEREIQVPLFGAAVKKPRPTEQ